MRPLLRRRWRRRWSSTEVLGHPRRALDPGFFLPLTRSRPLTPRCGRRILRPFEARRGCDGSGLGLAQLVKRVCARGAAPASAPPSHLRCLVQVHVVFFRAHDGAPPSCTVGPGPPQGSASVGRCARRCMVFCSRKICRRGVSVQPRCARQALLVCRLCNMFSSSLQVAQWTGVSFFVPSQRWRICDPLCADLYRLPHSGSRFKGAVGDARAIASPL